MSRNLELPTLQELAWMEPAELEAALVAVEHARRVTEAVLIDVLDVADRQRVWAVDGHRSVKNWAVALAGISPAEAARRCQVLRAMRDLDEVRDRLRAGELGVCQVRELARLHANRRVRERLTRAEQLMVAAARRRSFDEFRVRTDRWRQAADPDGAARSADEIHAARRVDTRFTATGFTFSAHGGTTARRWTIWPGPKPSDTSRRCETPARVPVDPRDAVVAALLGYVRRVVIDAAGVVVDAGRRRRLFTGALREVAWVQGTQCLWPGCGLTGRQQDHTAGWAHRHGTTEPANAGPVCGHHNRWKTRGYATWRDADGVWHVRRPDGSDVTDPRAA